MWRSSPACAGLFHCVEQARWSTTGRTTMATPDKVATVKALADQFRSAQAVYVTEYRGLSVAQLKQLRKGLSGTATYAVVKNTLAARAAKDAGLEGLEALFVGPTAVAFAVSYTHLRAHETK